MKIAVCLLIFLALPMSATADILDDTTSKEVMEAQLRIVRAGARIGVYCTKQALGNTKTIDEINQEINECIESMVDEIRKSSIEKEKED